MLYYINSSINKLSSYILLVLFSKSRLHHVNKIKCLISEPANWDIFIKHTVEKVYVVKLLYFY